MLDNDLWLTVHYLDQPIGFIWVELFPEKHEAFGFDIYLDEKFHSQGLGRAVMLKCGEMLKQINISKIKICVYEHNKIARSLYLSLGFHEEKFDPERGQHYLAMDI